MAIILFEFSHLRIIYVRKLYFARRRRTLFNDPMNERYLCSLFSLIGNGITCRKLRRPHTIMYVLYCAPEGATKIHKYTRRRHFLLNRLICLQIWYNFSRTIIMKVVKSVYIGLEERDAAPNVNVNLREIDS